MREAFAAGEARGIRRLPPHVAIAAPEREDVREDVVVPADARRRPPRPGLGVAVCLKRGRGSAKADLKPPSGVDVELQVSPVVTQAPSKD